MRLLITVKIVDPITAGELQDLQKHYEMLRKEAALGPPDKVQLRYLLEKETNATT